MVLYGVIPRGKSGRNKSNSMNMILLEVLTKVMVIPVIYDVTLLTTIPNYSAFPAGHRWLGHFTEVAIHFQSSEVREVSILKFIVKEQIV